MRRIWTLFILILAFTGCEDSKGVVCPDDSVLVEGTCRTSCTTDNECLINEICASEQKACVPGFGERPNIVRFVTESEAVTLGRPVLLHYEVLNAEVMELNGLPISTPLPEGSVWSSPLTDPRLFSLTARGPGGRDVETVSVGVTNDISPPTIVSFEALPNPVPPRESARVEWQVYGADEVELFQAGEKIFTSTDPSGAHEFSPGPGIFNLMVVATNDSGTSESSIVLSVMGDQLAILRLDADPQVTIPGGNIVLDWSAPGAERVSIENDLGEQLHTSDIEAQHGPVVVPAPWTGDLEMTTDTTFHLYVERGKDAVEAQVGVAVRPPPGASFSLQPAIFEIPTTLHASWETTNAKTVAIYRESQPELLGASASGERDIPVSSTTRFELQAIGDPGTRKITKIAWTLTDLRNTSRRTPQPLGQTAVVQRNCSSSTVSPHRESWFAIDVNEGAHLMVSMKGTESPTCGQQSSLTLFAENNSAARGTVERHGTCPVIHPQVHGFASRLPAGRYLIKQTSQPACVPFLITAREIEPRCGNGIIDDGEHCDDTNTILGDGCKSDCTYEKGSDYKVITTQDSLPYAPLTTETPLELEPDSDEGSALIPLDFPFVYFGRPYQFVRIFSNGFISFSDFLDEGGDQPKPIPATTFPNAMVSALWSDLQMTNETGSEGGVFVGVRGIPPNRMLVIEYRDVAAASAPSTTYNAQIILEETANAIHIHYGEHSSNAGDEPTMITAGIENHQGLFGFGVPGCMFGCSLGTNTLPTNRRFSFVTSR